MTAVGRIRRPAIPSLKEGGPDASGAVISHRRVYFAEVCDAVECRIYNREALQAGNQILGPAVVEEYDSTTVIPPDFEARVDAQGNLVLRAHADPG